MERQFSRNELSEILTNQERTRFIINSVHYDTLKTYMGVDNIESGAYVRDLQRRLDGAGNDVQAICHAFAFISGLYDTDRVRFELARVPVWFFCLSSFEFGFSRIKVEKFKVKVADGRTFEVGSEQCPKHVFRSTPSKKDYRLGIGVLAFYPVALAEQLGFEITRTWIETDSLVDWIAEFAQTEGLRKHPRLEVVETENDRIYKLRYKSKADVDVPQVSDALQDVSLPESKPLILPDPKHSGLSPKEQTYNFIVANSPIRTKDIHAQKFTSKRHTYRIINELADEKRIEKIKHGTYIAI